jgi:hypothetical protein
MPKTKEAAASPFLSFVRGLENVCETEAFCALQNGQVAASFSIALPQEAQ